MVSNPAPGPWKWYWRTNEDGDADCGIYWEKMEGQAISICRAPRYEKREQWEANAELIVHSQDRIADLEAKLAEAQAELEVLRPENMLLRQEVEHLWANDNWLQEHIHELVVDSRNDTEVCYWFRNCGDLDGHATLHEAIDAAREQEEVE